MTAKAFQAKDWFGRLLLVKREEYTAVAWSFLYFACVLSSYYMIRPIREAMGAETGVDTLPYLFTTTFVVMLAVMTPLFGWVSSRYTRRQFIPWVYLFFAVNLLLFWAAYTYAIRNGIDYIWLGRVFFVWLSIFNLYVVSVFWSFMADIYTKGQGRRLFGLISAGGSGGAILAPFLTAYLTTRIDFQNLLPLSACLLLVAIICIGRLQQWVRTDRGEAKLEAFRTKPLGGSALGGIKQVLGSRYLLSIAVISILASLLGTALYMFMADIVGQNFATTNERTRVFALLDGFSNLISFVGAGLLVGRSVRHFGIGKTLLIMPVISLIGFAILALNPVFLAVAILQAVRRGIGFGFTKPSMDMLYSVVPDSQKYKAKNFIDTTIYRGGDLVGTWTISFLWAFGIAGIAIVMLPFAALWVWLAQWLGKDYKRRDAEGIGSETT